MKLNINTKTLIISVVFIMVIGNSFQGLLKKGKVDDVITTLNFYDKTFNENSSLSCKVKISVKSESCKIGDKPVMTGKMMIKLQENPGDIAEENASKEVAKKGPPLHQQQALPSTENVSFVEKKSSSVISEVSEAVKGALFKIGQIFSFRFASGTSKDEDNLLLLQKDEKDKPKDGKSDAPPKMDKDERCNHRVKRLALNGVFDTRYIQTCKVDFEENTAGGLSVKFTAVSRESEDSNLKLVEFVIPKDNGINKDTVTAFVKTLVDTCKDSEARIKDVLDILENNYCKKKIAPKKFDKCEDIKCKPWSEKCSNMETDIKNTKEETKKLQESIAEAEKENEKCKKELMDKSTEKELTENKAKDMEKEKESLKKKAEDLKKDAEKNKQEEEKHSKTVLEAKKKKEGIDKEKEKLAKDVDTANKIQDGTLEQEKALAQNKNEMSKEIAQLDKKIAQLKKEYKEVQAKIGDAGSKLEEAAKKGEEKNTSLQNTNKKVLDMEKRLAELNKEIPILEEKVKQHGENAKKREADEKKKDEKDNDTSANETAATEKSSNELCNKAKVIVAAPIKIKLEEACKLALSGDSEGKNIIAKILSNL